MGWRKIPVVLIGLIMLATAAWADQNLLIKGIEAQKAGKNEQAVTLLSHYLEQYPQIPEARRYLALALAGLGRQAEALKDTGPGVGQPTGGPPVAPDQGEPADQPGTAVRGHRGLKPGLEPATPRTPRP